MLAKANKQQSIISSKRISKINNLIRKVVIKMKFTINGTNKINDKIIDDSIFQEEKVDYKIVGREDDIDNLIDWMSEAEGNDRKLMKEDLKFLLSITDKYILSSISTNLYIQESTIEGQAILSEIYNK